jgi:hypothetical protein
MVWCVCTTKWIDPENNRRNMLQLPLNKARRAKQTGLNFQETGQPTIIASEEGWLAPLTLQISPMLSGNVGERGQATLLSIHLPDLRFYELSCFSELELLMFCTLHVQLISLKEDSPRRWTSEGCSATHCAFRTPRPAVKPCSFFVLCILFLDEYAH